jgi:hypothetical protein
MRKILTRVRKLFPPSGLTREGPYSALRDAPDYLTWFERHAFKGDAGKIWDSAPLAQLASVPGMLSGEELQFLYFVAREFYSGLGEIVDAGAFLGASAQAFAAGLENNPAVRHKAKRIFSYDFFEFSDFYRSYLPDRQLTVGDDTLPLFHEFTKQFSAYITAAKGDICQQSWPRRNIEILFVDFTQRWQHHEFVVRNFYPNLIPGRSLLIHQDYVYTVCYWLHIFMEYYKNSFNLISPLIPNSTAAWLYNWPLPSEAFQTPLNERLSFSDLLALFDRSLATYSGTAAGLLKCARGRLILDGLGPIQATEYATMLEQEYRGDSKVLPHVTILRDEIRRLSPNLPE